MKSIRPSSTTAFCELIACANDQGPPVQRGMLLREGSHRRHSRATTRKSSAHGSVADGYGRFQIGDFGRAQGVSTVRRPDSRVSSSCPFVCDSLQAASESPPSIECDSPRASQMPQRVHEARARAPGCNPRSTIGATTPEPIVPRQVICAMLLRPPLPRKHDRPRRAMLSCERRSRRRGVSMRRLARDAT